MQNSDYIKNTASLPALRKGKNAGEYCSLHLRFSLPAFGNNKPEHQKAYSANKKCNPELRTAYSENKTSSSELRLSLFDNNTRVSGCRKCFSVCGKCNSERRKASSVYEKYNSERRKSNPVRAKCNSELRTVYPVNKICFLCHRAAHSAKKTYHTARAFWLDAGSNIKKKYRLTT